MRNMHWARWTALALALSFSAGCVASVGAQGRRGGGGGWGPPASQSRYVDPAVARGYEDGYNRGRADARSRDRYDARRHRLYRHALSGYDRRYGPRDAYKQMYRRAFTSGYEQGYRDARRGRGRW